MSMGTCYGCGGVPPICDECFDMRMTRWSDSARTFGHRWGALLRVALDHHGTVSRAWPAWDTDRAKNVREMCRRMVGPLAHAVTERRDERLVEAFAEICAAAAEEAYRDLSLDEARLILADQDRRFPGWRSTLPTRRG